MRKQPIDLVGQVFTHLTVIAYSSDQQWRCLCTCGKYTYVSRTSLIKGTTVSCGCMKGIKHGMHKTSEYKAWCHMRERCTNPNDQGWDRYGGRGITICQHWLVGENNKHPFLCFLEDMNLKPGSEYSLHRVDNDGNYEPTNCVWATDEEQNKVRSSTINLTINGETHSVTEWSKISGVDRNTIYRRLSNGYSFEEAVNYKPYQRRFLNST